MRTSLLVLMFVIVGWHHSVFAGVLTLDFDLSGSTFMARTPGGIPLFNVSDGVNGSVTGSARLELMGVDEFGVASGPLVSATLSNLSVVFDLNVTNFSVQNVDATLIGRIGILQVGAADFFFNGPQLTGNPTLQLSQDVDCVGNSATCASIGGAVGIMFPFRSVIPSSGTLTLNLLQLGISGSATLSGMVPPISLSGREVARQFVPEPATLHLIVLGLVAIAAVWTVSLVRAPRRRHAHLRRTIRA